MSAPEDEHDDEPDPVSFQPLPNIITAFSADASPFEALSESIDNSIDHIRSRAYEGQIPEEDLEITITFERRDSLTDSRIIVEDNAGGVETENLSRFFQWGASSTAPESIGRFGVGASRIAALGKVIVYQSRARGKSQGYGFEVNVSEMENHDGEVTEDTYQADRQEVEDLADGHTRIIIKDLKRDFIDIFGLEPDDDDRNSYDEQEEVSEEEWQDAVESLASQFGDYFERYISTGIQFDADYFPVETGKIDVDIEVKLRMPERTISESATPPSAIDYSYLPFDSLGPRKYVGVPFDEDEETPSEDAAVRADIEVGLMLSADDKKAGLTLYANDRKILSRDTANPLFTSDYLGRYRSESGHSRLVIAVELSGEIEEMPVNSLKSDLDMNSPISEPLLRIIKNAAKYYRKQTYSSMPKWLLEVYGSTNPFAANGGSVATYDKSKATTNSARFRNQPGSSSGSRTFPERDRLRAIVKIHRALRIRDETPLNPKEEPAYERYFESQYSEDASNSKYTVQDPVEVKGPEIDWEKISITADETKIGVITRIQGLAEQHYDAGIRIDDGNVLSEWQIPRYREELRRLARQADLAESDLKSLDTVSDNLLLDALEKLSTELGRVPSSDEMDELGLYDSELYVERFGSWKDALSEIDLDEVPDQESPRSTGTQGKSSESGGESSPASGNGIDKETIDSLQTSSEKGREDSTKQSIEGTGIVIDGNYYQIPNEDLEILNELFDTSDRSDPENAWKELKGVLEWYQQMPGR